MICVLSVMLEYPQGQRGSTVICRVGQVAAAVKAACALTLTLPNFSTTASAVRTSHLLLADVRDEPAICHVFCYAA
jgi:hypothetical protein